LVKLWFLSAPTVALGILVAGCGSGVDDSPPSLPDGMPAPSSELLQLAVDPSDAVVSNDRILADIETPCLPAILRGLGSFSDVGWVAPRFFSVAAPGAPEYGFVQLSSGRSRFHVQFRVPRSEEEAVAFHGDKERGAEPLLYCDVPGTLHHLSQTGIRRLASWPIPSVKAFIDFGDVHRELVFSANTWTSGGVLAATTELSRQETLELQDALKSQLGAQIIFRVSNRLQLPGCVQTLDGANSRSIDELGLKDGEGGGVAFGTLARVVSTLPKRATAVKQEGDCASLPLVTGASGSDGGRTAHCTRRGFALTCRTESDFAPGAFNIQSNAHIGENVAGVF
jgi:hypothetical protein